MNCFGYHRRKSCFLMNVANTEIALSEEQSTELSTNAIGEVMEPTFVPKSIYLENSSRVHIGSSLHYNAPVTVNQYVNVKESKGANKLQLHKQNILWGALVIVIIFITILGIVLYLLLFPRINQYSHSLVDDFVITSQPPPDEPEDPTLKLGNGHNIYPRSQWSIYSPKYTRQLAHPTPYVVISHTAESACYDPINCFQLLRNYQSYHVSEFEQPDIGYNFLIDPKGNVYEGRGWNATNFHGSFTKRRNIGVCFFGNYVYMEMTENEQRSLKDLLELGVRLNMLDADYKIVAHSQTHATLSPGKNILKVIDSWPHRCLSDCELPNN